MDENEAKMILESELGKYRLRDYNSLVRMIGDSDNYEIKGTSGVLYQLEVQVFWDDKAKGEIRVMAGIDDRGIRVYAPLTDDFIVNSLGDFIGE